MAEIAYSDVIERQLLPIDAREICTKVTLVVAGRPSGQVADMSDAALVNMSPFAREVVTHHPVPIVYEYEATEHAEYSAHKVYQLPEGINPFLPPTDPSIPDPVNDQGETFGGAVPSVLRDGDPGTRYRFAIMPGWSPQQAVYRYQEGLKYVGMRIMYAFDLNVIASAYDRFYAFGSSALQDNTGEYDRGYTNYRWSLDPTTDTQIRIVDSWGTFHLDARQGDPIVSPPDDDPFEILPPRPWNIGLYLFSAVGGSQGTIDVTHFYPLVLDENYLESIAKSHIRLPASSPSRIVVNDTVPISKIHTIVGWPGGDLEVSVARQTYERGITFIDVEQPGPPIGVPSDTFDAEKIRRHRQERDTHKALYPVRMTGR